MTLGQLIDSVTAALERQGRELQRVDWTHSTLFDNLRIGARRQGHHAQGPVVILKLNDGEEWSAQHLREAVDELIARTNG